MLSVYDWVAFMNIHTCLRSNPSFTLCSWIQSRCLVRRCFMCKSTYKFTNISWMRPSGRKHGQCHAVTATLTVVGLCPHWSLSQQPLRCVGPHFIELYNPAMTLRVSLYQNTRQRASKLWARVALASCSEQDCVNGHCMGNENHHKQRLTKSRQSLISPLPMPVTEKHLSTAAKRWTLFWMLW